MGILFSRKKDSISLPDFKAMLEKINKSMADHQAQRDRLIAARKKALWRLWLVTFFLVLITAGFAYLGYVAKKPLFLLPPLIIPIISYILHKIISFYYNRKTKRVETEQQELIAQIEEVRKITKLGEVSELFNPTPRQTPSNPRPQPVATPHTQPPPQRVAPQTPYPQPQPQPQPTPQRPPSTPFIPPSTPNATPKYIAVPTSNVKPGPVNSNVKIEETKSKPGMVGWMLGMIVGDDETVPVKCEKCQAVNSYVSKNEAASAQFKCAFCGTFNGVEEAVKEVKREVKEKGTGKVKEEKVEELKQIQEELEEDEVEQPIELIQEQEDTVVIEEDKKTK
eukprot:TRINITY_DN3688_c0_g1_i1.p1 TRINITY_DN3688_c0_g1~~TRINITY_DN3688_c0_g1_i1.p1  ORF type:complete len:337 (-),score=91.49 TRINITY_DN3688_c0_g1_i1:35-1045(-)